MIKRIAIKNFRMLRANSIALAPFSVLVGKNATGKSTLLAAIRFVSDLVAGGVEQALSRALETDVPSFQELCFDPSQPIEIGMNLSIDHRPVRYEVRVGPGEDGSVVVLREILFILPMGDEPEDQLSLFGDDLDVVVHDKTPRYWRKVLEKNEQGKDYFRDEKTDWNNVFRFGRTRAALGAIPRMIDDRTAPRRKFSPVLARGCSE